MRYRPTLCCYVLVLRCPVLASYCAPSGTDLSAMGSTGGGYRAMGRMVLTEAMLLPGGEAKE
eukprot:3941522-Rhodomonas_salina.2